MPYACCGAAPADNVKFDCRSALSGLYLAGKVEVQPKGGTMPHTTNAPHELEGKPVIGSGDCVVLIQQVVQGLRGKHTSCWRAGEKVVGSKGLARGTAIATFEDGVYPQRHNKKHAALLVAYAGKSIYVMDQWNDKDKKTISTRLIRPGVPGVFNPSNSSEAFYVVEFGKCAF